MHFHAPLDRFVKRDMSESRRLEVAIGEDVDVIKHIQIECRGNAKCIVVRSVETCLVLLGIDSDQKTALGTAKIVDAAQETESFVRREIADARSRIKEGDRAGVDGSSQIEAARKISHHSHELHSGKHGRKPRQRGPDGRLGDVHRDIAARMQRRKKKRRFGTISCAEVDELATGSHRLNDGIAMRCENCALGTRRIVLRQRTDRLEQGATDIVVEILGRNDRRSGKQPGNKRPSLIVRIGVGVAAVEQADAGGRRVLGDGMQCGGRLGHERSVKCRSRVVEKVQKTLRRWPTCGVCRTILAADAATCAIPTAPADRFFVTQPPPIRSTLAAGNLGLYDIGNFFLTTGRAALPLGSVIPQALWYFELEPIAIARAGLPIAGFTRDASATKDVAAWAAQRSTAMPLEYPSLIWIAAPEVIRGARLVANGTRIEANGNTWAFDVVPKTALNRSYYDQTSIAFLGMQPLTIRGWLQQETFVARTIWPEAFRLDDCAPSRHVDASAQAIRRLVREESAG